MINVLRGAGIAGILVGHSLTLIFSPELRAQERRQDIQVCLNREFQSRLVAALDCDRGVTEACQARALARLSEYGGATMLGLAVGSGYAIFRAHQAQEMVGKFDRLREMAGVLNRTSLIWAGQIRAQIGQFVAAADAGDVARANKIRANLESNLGKHGVSYRTAAAEPSHDWLDRAYLNVKEGMSRQFMRDFIQDEIDDLIKNQPRHKLQLESLKESLHRAMPNSSFAERYKDDVKYRESAARQTASSATRARTLGPAGVGVGAAGALGLYFLPDLVLSRRSQGTPMAMTFSEAGKAKEYMQMTMDGRVSVNVENLKYLFEDRARAAKMLQEVPQLCEALREIDARLMKRDEAASLTDVNCLDFPRSVQLRGQLTYGQGEYAVRIHEDRFEIDHPRAKRAYTLVRNPNDQWVMSEVDNKSNLVLPTKLEPQRLRATFLQNTRGCQDREDRFMAFQCEAGEDIHRLSTWIFSGLEVCARRAARTSGTSDSSTGPSPAAKTR